VNLGDGVGFEMAIVGESYYGLEIKRIAGTRLARGEEVVFKQLLQSRVAVGAVDIWRNRVHPNDAILVVLIGLIANATDACRLRENFLQK